MCHSATPSCHASPHPPVQKVAPSLAKALAHYPPCHRSSLACSFFFIFFFFSLPLFFPHLHLASRHTSQSTRCQSASGAFVPPCRRWPARPLPLAFTLPRLTPMASVEHIILYPPCAYLFGPILWPTL